MKSGKDLCDAETLLQLALERGLPVRGICGGRGKCGKCKIRVTGQVTPPIPAELDLLTPEGLSANVRLACQARALGEVHLEPVDSLETLQYALADVQPFPRHVKLQPAVKSYAVRMNPPKLDDQRSDFERLRQALELAGAQGIWRVDLVVLRMAPSILRRASWNIACSLTSEPTQEIVSLRSNSSNVDRALAVDLGTSNIVLYLVDFHSGQMVAGVNIPDPQATLGLDARSRLEYPSNGKKEADQLRSLVTHGLQEGIRWLLSLTSTDPGDVMDIVVVGNTAMHHLFLGLPVKHLVVAPFVPVISESLYFKAREMGFGLAHGAYVFLPPPVAGYVGSDHLAMLLGSVLMEYEGPVLGIDVGTNTEVALKIGQELHVCSCASGPAFEGAHMRWGMRALPGAIVKVKINPVTSDFEIETIGQKTPVGICGSCVIQLIAELRKHGFLDERARLIVSKPGVREGPDGLLEVVLAGDVSLGQQGIVELRLACAAVQAAILVLLNEVGVDASAIQQVLLAGAFGTHLDCLASVEAGLFPSGLKPEYFRQVENTAGTGAAMMALSVPCRREVESLGRAINYVELAVHDHFHSAFTTALATCH